MPDKGQKINEQRITPTQQTKLTQTSLDDNNISNGPCTLSKEYYDNCVDPLLKLLQSLTLDSYNIAFSANNLSNIYAAKNSDIKDAVHLADKLIDKCDDVFDVLEDKIDELLRLYKYNP